jgi:acyl carrier protein
MSPDLAAVVITHCATALGVERDELSESTELASFATWDSLAAVLFVDLLEEALGADVDPERVLASTTVADLVTAVTQRAR